MKQTTFIALATVAWMALFFLSGCASTQVESPFANRLDSLSLTVGEIRQRNLERVIRGAALIESGSDSIIHSSTDATVRKNAITWKMNTVPALRQALLLADPIASALDGWAFSVQMRQFLETGGGKGLFGNQQDIAIRTAHSVESLFGDAMGRSIEPGRMTSAQHRIEEWATNHPMESPLYERPSIIPYLEELKVVDKGSIASAVGNIAQTTQDLSDRMNIYLSQLPREGRWQAEYLLGSVPARLDSLEFKAATISATVTRMTQLMEEGQLVLDVRSLQHLQADLRTLEEQITHEREALLAEIDRQRLETINGVNQAATLTIQEASQQAQDLVDHLAWRLAEVLVGGIVVFGIMFIVLNRFRRPTSSAH